MYNPGWGILWKVLLSRLGLFRELFSTNGSSSSDKGRHTHTPHPNSSRGGGGHHLEERVTTREQKRKEGDRESRKRTKEI